MIKKAWKYLEGKKRRVANTAFALYCIPGKELIPVVGDYVNWALMGVGFAFGGTDMFMAMLKRKLNKGK